MCNRIKPQQSPDEKQQVFDRDIPLPAVLFLMEINQRQLLGFIAPYRQVKAKAFSNL